MKRHIQVGLSHRAQLVRLAHTSPNSSDEGERPEFGACLDEVDASEIAGRRTSQPSAESDIW